MIKNVYSIDSIVNHIKNNNFKGRVLIFLWSNGDRVKDEINCSNNCEHNVVDNYCNVCGGYVGMIGEEYYFEDYFKHVQYLDNIIESEEWYLISRHHIPEYVKTLKNSFVNEEFKRHRKTTYLISENLYVTKFYTKKIPTKYKMDVSRDNLYNYVKMKIYPDVVINPNKELLKLNTKMCLSNLGVKL